MKEIVVYIGNYYLHRKLLFTGQMRVRVVGRL